MVGIVPVLTPKIKNLDRVRGALEQKSDPLPELTEKKSFLTRAQET
jgi:hypothetical protein